MSGAFTLPGRHHGIWKEWRRIGKGKDQRFFLEHRQAVLESLSGRHPPAQVLLSRELHDTDASRWTGLASRHPEVAWYLIDGGCLDEVASVPANSGLCAVFAPRQAGLAELAARGFLMVAWELADPGNLGTLIRACQALGEGGVLAVGGCAPWTSKVARSSAGSLLKTDVVHLPCSEGREVLAFLVQAGFELYCAFPHAKRRLDQIRWGKKSALLLGNETRGLPADIGQSGQHFSIPISSEVESLNVAVAGSIVAWEWRRSLLSRLGEG